MSTTQVTDELKPRSQGSDFRIMVFCVVALALSLILLLFIARRVLIPEDVDFLKKSALLVFGSGALGGGLSVLKGTNDVRSGKIAVQVAKAAAPAKFDNIIDIAGSFIGNTELAKDEDGETDVQDDEAVSGDDGEVRL